MSSIQERLQLKRVPLDTWNIREQLCLASAVVRSGDQNWMSVSRALKTVSEPNRPNDWYSQKSCAAQYGALLEHVETPKRKKRSSEGAAETPQESILKRLTQERIVEIQKNVAEMTQQYEQIQNEIIEVRNQSTSEERLREIWTSIEAAKRVRERENARRAAWLKEREEKRARAERTWRPPAQAQPGAPAPSPPVAPSSPLLTSLLKSSPVVTTPQHISHPANVVETVSPSAGAPTLSMLLEKSGASPHETKHAAIEHIKSQLVQIEHQLKASGSTPPPALAGPLDLDDIDIKPEDVYAFRDVDLPIPPLSVHKPARPTEKQFKKEDGDGVPETSAKEDTVQVDTVQVIAGQVAPGQVDEVKIAFPEVKFPTPEIKVIQDESKIKEEVKEPEVPVPEPEVEPEVMVDVENESEIVVEDTSVQPEQQPAVEPEVAEEQPGTAPATFDIPLPPEAEETTVVDVPEPPLAEEEQLQVTTVEIEPEVTEAAPEVAPEAEVTTVDVKTEEEEEVPLNTLVQEEVPTVPEVEVKEEQPEPEETHTETDDDTPMELSREEEKDGKKKRDYSRKKKPDSRACSGSESAAEASAPESPSASDAERQHKLWKKSVMLVYSRLCAHKYASLFLRPISDEEAPGYSMVVRRPMDLTTIRRNIEAGHIRTTAEFQRDVLLMLSNALMYNSSEHSVYMMARDMHDEAHSQLSILVAAQAHAGLVAAPARRKRRRPDSPPPAPAPAAPKRHH